MAKEKKIKVEDGNNKPEEEIKDEAQQQNPETDKEDNTDKKAEDSNKNEETTDNTEEKDPLEVAQAEIAELKDKYLRSVAEFDNYRKRTLKEKAELILNGGEKTISAILPILDDFERAIADKNEDAKAIKEGFELIYKKFNKTLEGMGVKGIINDKEIFAINYKTASNIIDTSIIKDKVEELSQMGKTPMVFIYDNKIIGIIAVSDVIKEDSIDAISEFYKLGITPIMLTGDNSITAKYIADKVDIKYFISDVLPKGKKDVVKELKKYGNVIMIGDGINDAVALAEANIGIAIGKGSDIAIDQASIVLVKSSLRDAASAIRLSKYTLLNIKENLFWAFFYNLIMIPIAAGAFSMTNIEFLAKMKPWYGALAMSLSSFFVVMNSLRINLFNPYKNRSNKKNYIINDEIFNNINKNIEEYKNVIEINEFKKEEYNAIIDIEGMMCEMCVKHVKDALESINGISNVNVSLDDNNAKVLIDNVSDDEIINVIEKEDYKVVNIKRRQ
jgi:molecular chaperone GrpE (heat shock protein)/copper chaperone CopZ/3-deoxy-D-manno-octulosonate 8-phosphate phosphatase KdsC-like HAD superfamily phosphatase